MADITSELERTTIAPPKAHIKRLKIIAAERGVSMASLIREAIADKLAKERPKPMLGIFDSGRTDLSQLASDMRLFEPPEWRSS